MVDVVSRDAAPFALTLPRGRLEALTVTMAGTTTRHTWRKGAPL